MVNYERVSAFVWEWLETKLPTNLYYHGLHHVQDVLEAVERFAVIEKVTEEEALLLRTAVLLHDSGFAFQYFNNEPVGAQIARDTLPDFGYTPQQISHIAEMILATALPQTPKDKLAQILCDADLDYLGREDFYSIAHTLRQEWSAYGIQTTLKQWYEQQLNFVSRHSYWTEAARQLRETLKHKHVAEMKELLAR